MLATFLALSEMSILKKSSPDLGLLGVPLRLAVSVNTKYHIFTTQLIVALQIVEVATLLGVRSRRSRIRFAQSEGTLSSLTSRARLHALVRQAVAHHACTLLFTYQRAHMSDMRAV